MLPQKLGVLSKPDVRTVWENEARHFTPWLAEEDNLNKLGEAIGLGALEFEKTEAKVGPYFADILAKSMDDYVVIENQLEKTDHSHLGQAITYASVLKAKFVVWVSTRFSDEHRQAVEWLNDMAGSGFGFYAVQVELLKIDDSSPAVVFNVVARPNIIRRDDLINKDLSQTQQLQWEFWTDFCSALISSKIAISPRPPQPGNRYYLPIGRSGFKLTPVIDATNKRVGIQVYLRNRVAAKAFPLLLQQQNEIEAALGEKLEWGIGNTGEDKAIGLWCNMELSDKPQWRGVINWLIEQVDKFIEIFGPRIKSLDLSTSQDGWTEE